jgi:hypothetical protein
MYKFGLAVLVHVLWVATDERFVKFADARKQFAVSHVLHRFANAIVETQSSLVRNARESG